MGPNEQKQYFAELRQIVSAGTINRNNRLIGRFPMILINRLLKQKIDHFRLLFLLTWLKFPL